MVKNMATQINCHGILQKKSEVEYKGGNKHDD